MGREKNPKADKAFELYKIGMKLVDIAKELEVPDGTVRRWKNIYNWEEKQKNKKKQNERSERESERSETLKHVSKAARKKDGTKDTLDHDELTPEQQIFCILYIRTFNATQSYQQAYGCSYETAMRAGSRLLRKVEIKKEIERLKEIKRQQIQCDIDDLIELNMRIAFGDLGNYIQFGHKVVPITDDSGNPVMMKDKVTGVEVPITHEVNIVTLNNSHYTDTQIIKKVKQDAKGGVSIELKDANQAMQWLEKFFMLNPMDAHRQEFDKRKLEIEMMKIKETAKNEAGTEEMTEDNFIEKLNNTAKDVWDENE